MDKSEIQRWIDKHFTKLLDEYGLSHWFVSIDLTTLQGGTAGECYTYPEYEQASINVDYTKVDGEAELERIVRHEICHIIHSPFELFWDAMEQGLTREDKTNVLRKAFLQAAELTVKNLERMHQGHVTALSKANKPKKKVKKRVKK